MNLFRTLTLANLQVQQPSIAVENEVTSRRVYITSEAFFDPAVSDALNLILNYYSSHISPLFTFLLAGRSERHPVREREGRYQNAVL